jgi:hypothetical protein
MVLNLAFNSTLEEHIGNLGNTLGTHWEHEGNNGKMKKIKSCPPTTQNFQENKIKRL